jgi:hypothetical protein
LVKESVIFAFHELITPRQVRRDPAVDVAKPVGCESAPSPESFIHRLWVTSAKALDDHEKHGNLAALTRRDALETQQRLSMRVYYPLSAATSKGGSRDWYGSAKRTVFAT